MTLPAIAPVATFVVVTSTIGSFQLFELPYTLLQNSNSGFGPNNSGLTIVGYLYRYAFETGDLGTAAAVGWLLTFIILVVSLVQIRLSSTVRERRDERRCTGSLLALVGGLRRAAAVSRRLAIALRARSTLLASSATVMLHAVRRG